MADIWPDMLAGFREIFSSPFKDPSIFWLLSPIIVFWFIMEIYFSRYKKEKLGWNSALGYGLSMFWIVVISLKTIFENNFTLFSVDKLLFIIFVALYSIFIIFVSFTHRMQAKIFFLFTSPTLVYYLFGVALLVVNGLLNMSFWVIIDLVILYMLILIFEFILKKIIPSAPDPDIGNSESSEPDMGFGSNDFNAGRGMRKF